MKPLGISIKDTAKVLGVGRTTVYVMIGDGRLEIFKIGKRTLVKMESVHRVSAGQG